jgi:hypothetical protein
LSKTKTPAHNVQWQNPGLHQFSLELESAPYYIDLKGCMTQELSSSNDASFNLSGCGISGLDGEYWITNDLDGNEIWVEKNNGWAIIFTNDANYTPEFCRSTGGTPTTANPTKGPTSKPTPNPTKMPTNDPTPNPTKVPTDEPTNPPTKIPTSEPSKKPTLFPTLAPVTPSPTGKGPLTPMPTPSPTPNPTTSPTAEPTKKRTDPPTKKPTPKPTVDPTSNPTPKPTPNPTLNPTSFPTPQPTPNPTLSPTPGTGGTVCCAARNTGYQECNSDSWCNENVSNCTQCNGEMMSVPIVRTGCCSWGGNCSGYDPSSNSGCQYLQSDCEGNCHGTWKPF